MKNTAKILVVAMFAIILFSGLASAVTVTPSSHTLLKSETTFNIVMTSSTNAVETVSISIPVIKDRSGKTITFSNYATSIELADDEVKTIAITYAIESGFNFGFGEKLAETKINITGDTPSQFFNVKFEMDSFCGDKNEFDASIKFEIDDISVTDGFGSNDDWYLRDTVKIDIIFEDPNVDIEDIDIEWEIWSNGEMIDDGEESMSDVDENEDEEITLTIKLDRDMDDYDEDAVLYVRAIGKTNDKDDNKDNKKVCEWDSESVDIKLDKNFVIVDELKINEKSVEYKYEVSCNQEITISGEVVNIGTKDQDDLYIDIYSSVLGVNKRIDFNEIKSFDSDDFSYTFNIPEGMTGTAKMTIKVYDDDNDVFENGDDDKSTQTIQFTTTGNCKVLKPTVAVKALDTTPKSGEEMIITATITNLNDKSVVYTLTAEGFQKWATLKDISPEVVQLAKGESKEITFKLDIKKDAEGKKFFNIETIENKKIILSQPVEVTVEKATLALGNVTELFSKKNLQIIGIVILNLILLVAIILVARKILRKK